MMQTLFLIAITFTSIQSDQCIISDTYDYVIIGAGTAGSIVASELSKEYTVLLIEEGGWSSQWDIIADGSKYWDVIENAQIQRGYTTVPQINLNDRIVSQGRAKITGGCNSHNTMQHNLGQRKDFDERWNIDGWRWNDLETFWNHISSTFKTTKVGANNGDIDEWIDRFLAVTDDEGYIFTDDHNDLSNTPRNRAWIKETMGQVTSSGNFGRRETSWMAYIDPILHERDNLDVIVYTRVNKILFNTKKKCSKASAIGVETYGIGDNKIHYFYASKEVILSAGAYDSPKILMLSGVGNCDYLNTLNIECIVNVPAVGQHLEDHNFMYIQSPPLKNQSIEIPFKPFTAINYGIQAMKDEGEYHNSLDIITSPWIPPIPDTTTKVLQSIFELFQLHSRGEILLFDDNPQSKPIINPNYLSDKRDENIIINAFRESRKLLYNHRLTPFYDENADELFPGFDIDSDEEIIEFAKKYLFSDSHPGSTCKMGNKFNTNNLYDIVVDNELKVRDINNLRVIDHSIVPKVVSGNTNAVTMIIGFKGADLILNHQQHHHHHHYYRHKYN